MTGNPVRREIIEASSQQKTSKIKKVTILVLGGSQGAHRVNSLVTEAAEELVKEYGTTLSVIHQTGKADEEDVRSRYKKIGFQAQVRAFFQDMAELYTIADLVISRAGATTLAELAVMGLPALLIPYPYAADDHQRTNGLYYEDGGAARMFLENELSGEILAGEIKNLLNNPELLSQMSDNMRSMGKPEATDCIIDACLALIDNKKAKADA